MSVVNLRIDKRFHVKFGTKRTPLTSNPSWKKKYPFLSTGTDSPLGIVTGLLNMFMVKFLSK